MIHIARRQSAWITWLRIAAIALVVSLAGCAASGPEEPRTVDEFMSQPRLAP